MILLLTSTDDEHARIVAGKLAKRDAKYFWFDSAQFPACAQICLKYSAMGQLRYSMQVDGKELDLSQITAVWDRRPNLPVPHEELKDTLVRKYVEREAKEFITDLWQTLDCLWVPARGSIVYRGQYKASQLKLAASLGFEIPPTLITNSPQEFLEFYCQHNGNIVSKSFYHGTTHFAGGAENGSWDVYTEVVSNRDVAYAQSIKYCPMIFQAYVPKRVELRVTVVGQEVFAAEIHSQHTQHTRHDWRRYDLRHTPHRPHHLPDAERQLCLRLVEQMGLCYGAIDLVFTPDGRYVFLEINPSGQYAWIEELTGMPISDAMCDLLLSREGANANA